MAKIETVQASVKVELSMKKWIKLLSSKTVVKKLEKLGSEENLLLD